MTKHKRKYENYIKKTQQKQMINAFILPQLNGELKKLGLGFDESTNKLYMRYGGNNKLPDLFTQAVKQTLITYLKPILDNYDVDFEDNFKHSIAIQRSLGKILFKEIK